MGGFTEKVDISIKNLTSLTNLSLNIFGTINEVIITRLLDQVPHIQELHLNGNLSYFNFDNFVNLTVLSLSGDIKENFNFELFKNLCNQLEAITIRFYNIDEKILFNLFDGYTFPYLLDLTIEFLDMKRLTKEFINRLTIVRQLNLSCCEFEVIEHDSFLNIQHLTSLDLSKNLIERINKNAFSNLKNLQKLDLTENKLANFDPKFIGLRESTFTFIVEF